MLTSAQLRAEMDAARKKLAARKPEHAAAASGPLTVVAPPAEIERMQALAHQADASVLAPGAASAPADSMSIPLIPGPSAAPAP